MRIWPMGLDENLPDEDVNIGESGLGSDAAIDEVIAELGDENTIIPVSDLEKLTDLDAELMEVLNDATQHRRKKLQEWFRNNTKGKTTPGGTSTSKILSTLLGQLKVLVSDDIKENKLVLPDQKLRAVWHHTSECFSKELEDVKDEVRDETLRINAARKLQLISSLGCAIQELPIVLGQIFEELSTLTGGWHYSLVMGGQDPLCEGDIMTLSYHHGKTLDGLSFKTSTANFHEQYLLPFERHLGRIYGASLPRTSVPASAPSTSPSTIDFISTSGPNDPLDHHASSSSLPLGQESNTCGLVLDPVPLSAHVYSMDFNLTPQLNGPQGYQYPDLFSYNLAGPMQPDSPITAWRNEYTSDENPIMSTALPQTQEPSLPSSFSNNANLFPAHDLSFTHVTPLLSLHQPFPPVPSLQPSLPLSLPCPALPLSSPSLPLSLPQPALPLSLAQPVLPLSLPPLSLPQPTLPLLLPQPAMPLLLPQPTLSLLLPQPALPLEAEQGALVPNLEPLMSSEQIVGTKARRSGREGRPSARAKEANEMGNVVPKKKRNSEQPSASESRKKTRK
ncbi:uncharacterized protein HD556DRAFT_1442622 [Suillus plorans]|uniref:Uncharacterized protein n=1 Tax=Suillus plorans TaxID=116603 RepID=A0A9P7AR94_9AGAM|nr:uncharacterized protein HD556DRAFT_1442622 [Suillus plorans]KAG1794836.1 hypothetical protein HD556DRAFT_1442622 [Suillus plorans]